MNMQETNNKEQKNSQYNIISFKKGFTSPNLPIIALYHNGQVCNFMIDTGCDDNVISSHVVEELDYNILEDKHRLSGLGGSQDTSSCEIELSFNGTALTVKFLIANLETPLKEIEESYGIKLYGMIGSKYLREHGFVLDFEQLIAYNKK